MKRLEITEVIFKILSYVFITALVLVTLYPFIYSISMAISEKQAVETGQVFLLPIGVQFEAVGKLLFGEFSKTFWKAYTNTLFYTLYGTIFSIVLSIFAAFALSRRNLMGKGLIQFMIVFTMWFSAGTIPMWLNFIDLGVNNRWAIIYGFGLQAFNILLLRNYFNGISREIEEASIVDGANQFQVLTKIYVPMSKSAIATVTLFYALNRWNGYFWNRQLVDETGHPLQVVLNSLMERLKNPGEVVLTNIAAENLIFSAIVLSIIPIIIIYPFIQKYFAQGVNVGGVKE
ncbi:MAG: carbohydrate ABC transporter permease [Acholeplasmatales bacterium]|nr:carbohydrate ABC transporter permease [Acholeplasmatales bacterium]